MQAKSLMSRIHALNRRLSDIEGIDSAASSLNNGKPDRVLNDKRRLSRMTAIVDVELCACCAVCVGACPQEAVSLDDIVRIDSHRCNDCGECVEPCPNDAIALREMENVAAS